MISNGHGFYRRDVYLDEARRWGCRILPMDIGDSRLRYIGRDGRIRPGLMHVRGVRRADLEAIEAERGDHGAFRDLADFVERMAGSASRILLHMAEIERLILVGAFDRLSGSPSPRACGSSTTPSMPSGARRRRAPACSRPRAPRSRWRGRSRRASWATTTWPSGA